jgi:hypothetical protein
MSPSAYTASVKPMPEPMTSEINIPNIVLLEYEWFFMEGSQ